MGKEDKILGTWIQDIANGGANKLSATVMSGKVVAGSVDAANGVCKVLINMHDTETAAAEGILLNAVSMNSNGMMLYPADNSQVWIAEIDGQGKWGLIKCSNLVRMIITIGDRKLTIQGDEAFFDAGGNGGLTITPELKKQLDKNNELLTAILNVINGAPIPEPGSGAASALQTAFQGAVATKSLGDFSNIENKKIKH